MDVMSVIKEHPIPIGIGVVVILLIVMSRGSAAASSGSGAGAYLASQQTAANSNNAIAALNTQGSIALGAQSVERYKIAEDAATARMGLAAAIFNKTTDTQAQVAVSNSNTLFKTIQASNQHSENMTAIADNYDVAQRKIAADVQTAGAALQVSQFAIQNDNNFKMSQLALTAQNLPMLLQNSESMAKISGQNAIAIANANNYARNTQANSQASAQKSSSEMGWVKLGISAIAAFF